MNEGDWGALQALAQAWGVSGEMGEIGVPAAYGYRLQSQPVWYPPATSRPCGGKRVPRGPSLSFPICEWG